jgi:hypothetical protein
MGASLLSFFEVVDGAEAHHPEIAGVRAMARAGAKPWVARAATVAICGCGAAVPRENAGNGNQADGMVTPR